MNPARSGKCESRFVQPVLRRGAISFSTEPPFRYPRTPRRDRSLRSIRCWFAAAFTLRRRNWCRNASPLVTRVQTVARFATIQFRPPAARSIHTPLNKRSGESPRTWTSRKEAGATVRGSKFATDR